MYKRRYPLRTMLQSSRSHWLVLALWASVAAAQTAPPLPEWVEEKPMAPPAFATDQLIPIEMPRYVSVDVGVDPATITVSSDRVVRYVVVMRNASGASSAAYEGLRCTTDEVKTYARFGAAGQWVAVKEPEWKPINGNMPSKHAFAIARQGACDAHLSSNREETIRLLKQRQRIPR